MACPDERAEAAQGDVRPEPGAVGQGGADGDEDEPRGPAKHDQQPRQGRRDPPVRDAAFEPEEQRERGDAQNDVREHRHAVGEGRRRRGVQAGAADGQQGEEDARGPRQSRSPQNLTHVLVWWSDHQATTPIMLTLSCGRRPGPPLSPQGQEPMLPDAKSGLSQIKVDRTVVLLY